MYSQQTDRDVPKRRGLTGASEQQISEHSHSKDYRYDDDDDDDDSLMGQVWV